MVLVNAAVMWGIARYLIIGSALAGVFIALDDAKPSDVNPGAVVLVVVLWPFVLAAVVGAMIGVAFKKRGDDAPR